MCALPTGHVPGLRNDGDLSSLATPVDPVLSQTVEAAHAAWVAEHGDAGM